MDWYSSTYENQLNESDLTPIDHYLTVGWKEGNDPSPQFSTNGYLVTYKDVKDSGMCPLAHFIANGQIEGREAVAKKIFNSEALHNTLQITDELEIVQCSDVAYQNTSKVGIVCHVYYLDLFPNILEFISNLSISYCLYITTNKENAGAVERLVKNKVENYKINVVGNVGYDLLPFVETLPELVADGIEYVCKLHTKKGAANLEPYYDGIETVWSDLLIKPLISSNEIVNDIIFSFESDEKLGFICPASVFKSSKHLMYGNEIMVSDILSSISARTDPAQEWGFSAGSMFWSRLDNLLPLLSVDVINDSKASKTGSVASYWHAMERVLGLLPIINQKTVALSFIVDKDLTQFKLAKLGCHYKQYINRFGVGLTLATEHSLKKDAITISEYFPELIKDSNTPHEFDPILFYLRYGVFIGHEFSPDFNSAAYWHHYNDVINARMNPLVHYIEHGENQHRVAFPASNNHIKNIEIVSESGFFNEIFYNEENPDVFSSKTPAIEHFCRFGWKELRDPAANVDIWHLWQTLLDVSHSIINPVVYQALTNTLLPEIDTSQLIESGIKYKNEKIKRVCLFAGYDAEGVIDQSVIDYVKELSLHTDVYYLADSNIAESELEKLADYTIKKWAFRHGEYDFGSYSRLANNLVGWNVIEEYDELVLANDSCYLIDSLSPTFDKMHQKKTDWWGMQATKGISKTKEKQSNQFTVKQNLNDIKQTKLQSFEQESFYDFLIGSYFICFRKSVIVGGELKSLLNNVIKERSKLNIIRKYEIGLTRTLINAGYNFDTFIDELYPFHPIYTNNHFTLIENGFPLFKRFFLTENHYHVPDLWQWQDKLLALKPELNLTPLVDNLYRIASDEKLYRNFNITIDEHGEAQYPILLTDEEFTEQDELIEKDDNSWCFPVCAYDSNLSGNDRAVFEHVKSNADIKKIILTRNNKIDYQGENVEVYPLKSLEGQQALLRSKVIFIKHSPMINVPYPLNSNSHHFINLWHGIPLKKIGCASLDLQHMLPKLLNENIRNSAVICSSDVDKLAMASAFTPLTPDKLWLTGLPRIDTVLMEESKLPSDITVELNAIRRDLKDRKLLFFCPTFKNGQEDSYYQFSYQEKVFLNNWLKENNFVLGIREHMADSANSYYANLMDLDVIDLSGYKVKNIEVIYRVADILITDYSSCFIDFMVTGKPIISFAYDYDSYINAERGLFYDMEFAVPGDICKNFTELKRSLDRVVQGYNPFIQEIEYQYKRSLFFKYVDANNSSRLVEKVSDLLESRAELI